MNDNITTKIKEKLQSGETISPFLFVGGNLEILNNEIQNYALSLLQEFQIPKHYFYSLEDNNENIKIEQVKNFTKFAHSKPPYPFQIFFFENISRLTPSASNSLLKLFEEPGKYNIIFLSNSGENNVLETILSRVQIVSLGKEIQKNENIFFKEGIHSYIQNGNRDLFQYFFKTKCEKEEYLEFLNTLLEYIKTEKIHTQMAAELLDDINAIIQNNVNAKYIVDKWLFEIH